MRKLLSLFLSLTTLLVVSFSVVSAKGIAMEKGFYELGSDEVVNDDLFIGAETVEINGTVNGDLYAGAESVRINGTVNGDVHIGAGTVYLSGMIRDDVYIGAGSVTVSSAIVGDSLLIGAGDVNIDKESSVGGSLIVGSGTLTTFAPVGRNVMAGVGSFNLNSEVSGEVSVGAGDITIGPDTKIGKDLYYKLGEEETEIRISEKAFVAGKVQRLENRFGNEKEMAMAKEGFARGFQKMNIASRIISFLGALLIGYLALKYFGKAFTASAKIVSESFLKSVGVGFAVTVLAFPVLLILALTGVGLPLAGILLLMLLIKFYLAKLVVGFSLGNFITEKFGWSKMSDLAIFAIGLFGVYLLKWIPIFGFILSAIIMWAGIGALTLHFKSTHLSKKEH